MMSYREWLAVLLVACVGCGLVGCTNAITFVSSTTTGVEFNTVEGGQQTLRVGYRRTEGLIMPMTIEDEEKEGEQTETESELRKEAYSVLSGTHFESGSLFTAPFTTGRMTQVFATGKAAHDATEAVKKSLQTIKPSK